MDLKTLPNNKEAEEAVWSRLSITKVRGRSRATTCKNVSPLKLLNPASPNACCHIVLSNYGGGMVQGDQICLDVRCENGASLYLGSQANTRIYRTPDGRSCRQKITGRLETGALAVVNPDPIVPHEASEFAQVLEWDLAPDADLLLIDWINSGRRESGERFAYTSYRSEIRLKMGEETLLLDRYRSCPAQESPLAASRFGPYDTLLNMYIAGKKLTRLFEHFSTHFGNRERRQIQDITVESKNEFPTPKKIVTANRIDDRLLLVRALGQQRSDLQPILDYVFEQMAGTDYLGFNPLVRKY